MTSNSVSANLTGKVQQLLEQRQTHADALSRIDEALRQIQMAVQGLGGTLGGRRPGRPPTRPVVVAMAGPAAAPEARRRGRGNFAITAEESVTAFIQQNGNPTTKDITAHWRGEGRRWQGG